jgi:hypothetical protein
LKHYTARWKTKLPEKIFTAMLLVGAIAALATEKHHTGTSGTKNEHISIEVR